MFHRLFQKPLGDVDENDGSFISNIILCHVVVLMPSAIKSLENDNTKYTNMAPIKLLHK